MPSQEVATGADVPLPVLRQFRNDAFRKRIDEVLDATDRYDGTLPKAWKRVESTKLSLSHLAEPNTVDVKTVRHIEQLVDTVRNSGIRSLTVEAGHAYLYESMDDPSLCESLRTQFQHAHVLGRILEENRIEMRRMLFVDDYNPHPEADQVVPKLDLSAYVAFAEQHGFPPDYLVMEKDMAPVAAAMVDYMHRYQGLIFEDSEDADRKLLKRRKVELVKREKTMSCASLDAALTMLKFNYLAEGVVNVLPKHQGAEGFSFKGQQRKVRQILGEHLNLRVLPFFNIFTSDHPRVQHSSGAHHTLRKSR